MGLSLAANFNSARTAVRRLRPFLLPIDNQLESAALLLLLVQTVFLGTAEQPFTQGNKVRLPSLLRVS
jgi:hypothetical protein